MSRRIALFLAALATVLTVGLWNGQPAHAAPPVHTGVGAVSVSVSVSRIAPVAAALPTYRIVSGDTLGAIAARFCGSSSRYPSLAAGNGIANPNVIYAGRVINLTCTAAPAPARVVNSSSRAMIAVNYALAQVGKPYLWDAAGPNAFDCSGLILAAYARVGIRLPHQSEEQMNYGVPVSRSQLRPGDVIQPFFGHIVMYIGNGKIVEAPRPGLRVEVVPLYAFWRARRYV